ncbi:sensor histidine kinase [Micromonospora sp. NPDC003197]
MVNRWSTRELIAGLRYAVVGVGVGAFFALIARVSDPADDYPPLVLEAAVLVVVSVGLARWRRGRGLVPFTLVLVPVSMVFAGVIGAVMVGLFSIAVRRSWQVTAAVGAVHMSTLVVVFWLATEDPQAFWESVAIFLALDAALIASGMFVRSQRLLVHSLRERARDAEEQQRLRVEEARHLERERLAREMHDVLAHRISLLAVHAGALEFRRDASAEERHAAGVIRQSAYDALEDLREVIGMLRAERDTSVVERPQPTLSDLPALVEQARQAGASVTLDNRAAELSNVPTGLGRHVYRIVQEGLTNARKHAPGAQVRVTVEASGAKGLLVEVRNRLPVGGTVTEIPGTGTGLIGLRERVDLVGGRLEHTRTPDGEFRLRAWLPR